MNMIYVNVCTQNLGISTLLPVLTSTSIASQYRQDSGAKQFQPPSNTIQWIMDDYSTEGSLLNVSAGACGYVCI